MNNYLNFKGKNCVVTGAATGVGRAVATKFMELGANVYAMDINKVSDVTKYIKVDLCRKDQIDNAITQLPDKIDVLISNAALAGTTFMDYVFTVPEVFSVNYIACRYLVESLIPRMPRGSSIAVVSSTTGENWKDKMDLLGDLYENGDTFEKAVVWAENHIYDERVFNGTERPDCLYTFSKEALIYFVKRASFDILKKGVRINVLCPGGIDTPMVDEIARIVGTHEYDKAATNPIMDRAATPEEIADCLLFLSSSLSFSLNGCDITADFGFTPGVMFQRCTPNGEFI
ncbi:NAD(P)-dependent dehydrogenase (short-subunit alcohol dehydrogenase family) [Clostridium algifaecis]|uniref:NAD(P)-dependent dehydrogenase (Short-subunit alcohol dehydrogenase family) n=1 Tax=Clostridium algifaecis TaxID=1472040 RepID=A0ABS4KTF1_9CLOT|nr:SDR family oxidoreductase [Clostridium algifaecis]MBP2033331.1 NAD(P)-dependent dehydrogenase (short-subunit alcohol dehydrogenase family) [Clostridium algifaecis]